MANVQVGVPAEVKEIFEQIQKEKGFASLGEAFSYGTGIMVSRINAVRKYAKAKAGDKPKKERKAKAAPKAKAKKEKAPKAKAAPKEKAPKAKPAAALGF